MKIWLDDVRVPPDDTWTWCKTRDEAMDLICLAEVEEISFDHDLGKDANGNDLRGYDVAVLVEKLAYMGTMPRLTWAIHSANPVGRARIDAAMRGAERWWDMRERGETPQPLRGLVRFKGQGAVRFPS